MKKNKKKLTILEAYKAMHYFLEEYYNLTSSDDVGSLLGSMELQEDDLPRDVGLLQEWYDATNKALKKE